jgi:hypothetical protein
MAGFHFSRKCSNVVSKSGFKVCSIEEHDAQWGVEMYESGLASTDASADIGRTRHLAGRVNPPSQPIHIPGTVAVMSSGALAQTGARRKLSR